VWPKILQSVSFGAATRLFPEKKLAAKKRKSGVKSFGGKTKQFWRENGRRNRPGRPERFLANFTAKILCRQLCVQNSSNV
jgi:hypothetical protein